MSEAAAYRDLLIEQRARELLTVKEFAWMVGRAEMTIYRRIWAGRQPGAMRDGGRWLIDVTVAIPPMRSAAAKLAGGSV